jgi:nitrile hydratase
MDGVHDMGGMHGFGAVPQAEAEHESWEGRVAAIARWLMGHTTIDHFRHTIEQMPPAAYLSSRYYERWLWAAERMAVEQGWLDGSGHPISSGHPTSAPAAGTEPAMPPRYVDGQAVRVGNPVTPLHTRVPRYVRNHVGTIQRRSFAWPHPTAAAATGLHGPPDHVYAVAFDARELFGPEADHTIVLDVWERDLEEAS